jgi:hypothetical protein
LIGKSPEAKTLAIVTKPNISLRIFIIKISLIEKYLDKFLAY